MSETAVQKQQPMLTDEQLSQISKEDLVVKFQELQKFTSNLQASLEQTRNEAQKKMIRMETQKSLEIAKLKNIILNRYVASKENESELTTNQTDNFKPKESGPEQQLLTFVDPQINAIIVQLKKELDEMREKRDELQTEIDSWKFNPDSQLCKRLMAKCKKLLKENEELGKMVSSGAVAHLEHDLAYHKEILHEACENEQNINSFLAEMDNEMEVMQATIIHLQERVILAETKAESKQPPVVKLTSPTAVTDIDSSIEKMSS